MKNKYCNALSRHLKILAQAGVEGRDYVSSFREFVDLVEQLDEAAAAGVVSPAQRAAIQAVFTCMCKVNNNIQNSSEGYNVYRDESLRNSPTWEPTREAARAAVKELEA